MEILLTYPALLLLGTLSYIFLGHVLYIVTTYLLFPGMSSCKRLIYMLVIKVVGVSNQVTTPPHPPSTLCLVQLFWKLVGDHATAAPAPGRSVAVTFRKGVTPGASFRRPASTIASEPDRDHPAPD